MADGTIAGIGIRREEHVALFDGAVIGRLEAVDEAAELADDHLAVDVGDHRELVVLFTNTGRHGRAEQHGIHFPACVQHGVLDDIERDRIDVHTLERSWFGFNNSGWHLVCSCALG